MNIGLLKHGFRVTASWQPQIMSEVPTLCFHAGVVWDGLPGHYVLPPGLTDYLRIFVPELLQDVSLQTRLRLWFMLGCAPPHFLLEIREFLNNVFPEQWIGRGGPTAWPARSADLNLLFFLYLGPRILLFILLMSVTCPSCKNKHRMDSKRFVWHLEFSSVSGNHCSDVQHPVLKLEADTLRVLFNFQGAVTRKPCFRRPMFKKRFFFFIECAVNSSALGLALHFSFILYVYIYIYIYIYIYVCVCVCFFVCVCI